MKTWLSCVLPALVVAFLLPGCGGNSPAGPVSAPSPSPSSAGEVRTVLIPSFGFLLNPNAASFTNVDFPPAGTLDVTIDWQGPSQINVYAVDSSCPGFADITAGRCSVLAKDDSATTKPKVIRFAAVSTRVYSIWVHNAGTARENVSGLVAVTTAGPPPSPSTPPSSDPRASLAPGPVTRVTLYIYQQYRDGNPNSGGTQKDKVQDDQGRWVMNVNDFIVFDSSQRNASGELCQYRNPPAYELDDPDGIVMVRSSSNPFLYRVEVKEKGEFSLFSTVDNINSNNLQAIVK